MAFRQQKPVVSGVLHQPLAEERSATTCRFSSAAPAAATGSPRCKRSRSAKAAPRSTGTAGSQPLHLHRLLTFRDPLLRGAAVALEAHYRTAGQRQVGHDEVHAREQLPQVMLHLRYHPASVFQLAAWYRNPLYSAIGFWLGLPTGRGSSSAMPRSKLSLAGMRMAYFTARFSSAS